MYSPHIFGSVNYKLACVLYRIFFTIERVKQVLNLFVSALCAIALAAVPLTAVAEGSLDESSVPPIIITEIQTGAITASDEFIELYNQSSETVDIAGWQIRYINSTVTTGTTTLLTTITPTSGESILLESGKYYVVHTASVIVPPTTLGQTFTAALSKTDKAVALFGRDETVCQMVVQDAVAWEGTPGTTLGEGLGVVVSSANTNKDKLLQRYRDASGAYVDTNHNSLDASLSTTFLGASPGTDNTQLLEGLPTDIGDPSELARFDASDCTLPEPEEPPVDPPDESPPSTTEPNPDNDPDIDEDPTPAIPTGNAGLKSPQLSELLPNPASPRTDAQDEFIEFYNPNDAVFSLSGYVLETGLTTKRQYVFPVGTVLQPKSFVAFFSGDTGLALSNTSGQARLIDPLGRVLVGSDPYITAKDDQVWVLADGKWQWSTSPTPNAINIVKLPEPKIKAKTASASKKTAAKSATTKKSTTSNQKEDEETEAVAATTTTPASPLHPGVLALVGGFALLYGAYEYRQDVANKIRKFRANREARRSLR